MCKTAGLEEISSLFYDGLPLPSTIASYIRYDYSGEQQAILHHRNGVLVPVHNNVLPAHPSPLYFPAPIHRLRHSARGAVR